MASNHMISYGKKILQKKVLYYHYISDIPWGLVVILIIDFLCFILGSTVYFGIFRAIMEKEMENNKNF